MVPEPDSVPDTTMLCPTLSVAAVQLNWPAVPVMATPLRAVLTIASDVL